MHRRRQRLRHNRHRVWSSRILCSSTYNAVILIPNEELSSGNSLLLSPWGAESLSWSFTVNAPLQITGLGGVNVHSVTLYKDASNNIPFEFFGGAGGPYTWTVVSGVSSSWRPTFAEWLPYGFAYGDVVPELHRNDNRNGFERKCEFAV